MDLDRSGFSAVKVAVPGVLALAKRSPASVKYG
jgi:hypothetical protein